MNDDYSRKNRILSERNEWLEGERTRLETALKEIRFREAGSVLIAFIAGAILGAALMSLPYVYP